MVDTAAVIWADGPENMPNQPSKPAIRAWGTWVEGNIAALQSAGGKIYQTRTALYADVSQPANTSAWVLGDTTAAYNGIYRKVGASGSGSWVRVGDLPYTYINATDTGAGTPNAIQANSSIPVSGGSIIVLSVAAANTDSPVTVAFNGGSPITIKDYLGTDILKGELRAGSVVLGVISAGVFRLLFDKSYAFLPGANTGAGTVNAIQVSVDGPVDYTSPTTLLSFNVTGANTASPVSVSFNGGAALPIKTASGDNIGVGGFVAGMRPLGYIDGSVFRLVSDQASSAIVAQAETAAMQAQGYRDQAANYAALARNDKVVRAFVGDGVTTDFALPVDPGSANNITVNMSGAQQFKSAYTLVYLGTSPVVPTLRFSEAPPSGTPFEAEMGYAVAVGAPSTGSVGTSQLADNGVTLAKLADIATLSLLGRKSAGTGDPEVLSATDLRDLFLPNGNRIDGGFASYTANTALTVALPTDDTIPQITEGTEILKVTLTPKKTTSRFKARAVVIGSVSTVDNWAIALFSAGGANALHAVYAITPTANYVCELVLEWEWVPGVTTAVDVTIRAGSNPSKSLFLNGSSTGRIFGGAAHCTLSVEEIKA